ncbi:hypothetical protein GGI09_004866 [Coemansia sp. S100]|nr:hypothetical protein GGI09_004866 [Coemansia sp. S100]
MLLHALVPSINPDDHDDSLNTAADIRADLAFDHSKKLDVVAQLSANIDDNDNANDNIFGTSSSWEKLTIANKRTAAASSPHTTTTSRAKTSRTSTTSSTERSSSQTSTKKLTKSHTGSLVNTNIDHHIQHDSEFRTNFHVLFVGSINYVPNADRIFGIGQIASLTHSVARQIAVHHLRFHRQYKLQLQFGHDHDRNHYNLDWLVNVNIRCSI